MEFLIQFVDELEDIYYAAPLLWERLRGAVLRIVAVLASLLLEIAGIVLALKHPPLAMAVVFLLSVGLLFRVVLMPAAGPFLGN